jgi:hypothetical protein
MPPIQPPRFTIADIDQVLESIKRLPVIEAHHQNGTFQFRSDGGSVLNPVVVRYDSAMLHPQPGPKDTPPRLTLAQVQPVSDDRFERAVFVKEETSPLELGKHTVTGEVLQSSLTQTEHSAFLEHAKRLIAMQQEDPRLARLQKNLSLEALSDLQFNSTQWVHPVSATVEWFDQAVHGLRQHVLKHLKP